MGETNSTFGPNQKNHYFFFDSGPLFPGFRPLRATFKAVLIDVDMTKALQTKCKKCFGGPRMILHLLWQILFSSSKKQYGFFTTLADPPWYGKRPHFSWLFFWTPSLNIYRVRLFKTSIEKFFYKALKKTADCEKVCDCVQCTLCPGLHQLLQLSNTYDRTESMDSGQRSAIIWKSLPFAKLDGGNDQTEATIM